MHLEIPGAKSTPPRTDNLASLWLAWLGIGAPVAVFLAGFAVAALNKRLQPGAIQHTIFLALFLFTVAGVLMGFVTSATGLFLGRAYRAFHITGLSLNILCVIVAVVGVAYGKGQVEAARQRTAFRASALKSAVEVLNAEQTSAPKSKARPSLQAMPEEQAKISAGTQAFFRRMRAADLELSAASSLMLKSSVLEPAKIRTLKDIDDCRSVVQRLVRASRAHRQLILHAHEEMQQELETAGVSKQSAIRLSSQVAPKPTPQFQWLMDNRDSEERMCEAMLEMLTLLEKNAGAWRPVGRVVMFNDSREHEKYSATRDQILAEMEKQSKLADNNPLPRISSVAKQAASN